MLKRSIKYIDFNDNEIVEDFYFHISKSELVDLEVEIDGGLTVFLETIIKSQDYKEIVQQFKKIILRAYGEKSEDGKRFIKSDELREQFSQTAAFDALFIELATDDEAAANFLIGTLPKDFTPELEKKKSELNVLPKPAPPPGSPPAPPSR